MVGAPLARSTVQTMRSMVGARLLRSTVRNLGVAAHPIDCSDGAYTVRNVGGPASVVVAPLAWSTVHNMRSMVGAPLAG